MSLWTPSGEHKVPPPGDPSTPSGAAPPPGAPPPGSPPPPEGPPGAAAPSAGDMEELRRQLAGTPAEAVVANHCYGLFELAAVYLSQSPPLLDQAQLAIDALGYLVDGLGERLGETADTLKEALAQIRLAFVELARAGDAAQGSPADTDGPPGSSA